MKLGNLEVAILRDGTMKFDGGAFFGVVPKVLWQRLMPPDERNRVTVGLNCVLIKAGGKNILVDTGMGTKHVQKTLDNYGVQAGKLLPALHDAGLSPHDVDTVILSHLHFDHAGGCTIVGPSGKPVPAFPRAQYLVQRDDWDEATHPNDRNRAGYFEQDIMPLQEATQIEVLDGDTEVAQGVWVHLTRGHTAGHQVVFLDAAGQKACFFGDLVATEHHLPLAYSQSFDLYPVQLLQQKKERLAQAERERWLVLFDHGFDHKAGYLQREEGKLKLRPVEI